MDAAPSPVVDRFTDWLYNFCWLPENDGQPYHVTPGDLGGATAWGVTIAIFQAWEVKHQIYGSGIAQLQSATKPYLASLIRADFWNGVQCDAMFQGLDAMMADRCFGSGPRSPVILLQQTLGFPDDDVDGDLGPVTRSAVFAVNDRGDFLGRFNEANLAFLKTRGTYDLFGDGWTRRQNQLYARESALYAEPPASATS